MKRKNLAAVIAAALFMTAAFGRVTVQAAEKSAVMPQEGVTQEVHETEALNEASSLPQGVTKEIHETASASASSVESSLMDMGSREALKDSSVSPENTVETGKNGGIAQEAPEASSANSEKEGTEGVIQEVIKTTAVNNENSLPEGVTQEVYETVPTEEEKGLPEGITQEVYETTPVVQQKELPEGVIQEVYETTQVTEQEGLSQSAQALGRSSMPDMEELDIHAEDVVSMVMPVIPEGTYDFTLDPQNLLSRYSIYKEDYEEASIYFTNSSGEKLHTGTSDPAMAVNKSSVPVLLYVELEIRNEEGWPVTYTDMDSVGENGEKNIAFSLIPVSVSETGEKILHSESRISTDESGRAEMVLLLPGSEDNFDQIGDMYVAKEDAKWSSMGFAVSGACNTDGDWREINERSDKGETMKLHITYRMDALSEEQAAQLEGGVTPDPETGVVVFE